MDDQVQWLDDEQVLYALSGGAERPAIMDPADGGGEPRLVVSQAYSAVVVRGDPDRASLYHSDRAPGCQNRRQILKFLGAGAALFVLEPPRGKKLYSNPIQLA